MWLGLLGMVIAAAFTGAALYINVAEHPARMHLPPMEALVQWEPAYRRGVTMQGGLAVLGGACAIAGWWTTGERLWLAGGLVLLLNWPYTLLVIMPVNRVLQSATHDDGSVSARLEQWSRLHAGRTLLGAVATALMFVGAL